MNGEGRLAAGPRRHRTRSVPAEAVTLIRLAADLRATVAALVDAFVRPSQVWARVEAEARANVARALHLELAVDRAAVDELVLLLREGAS